MDAEVQSVEEARVVPSTIPLQIATWNMNHWQRTIDQQAKGWDHLEHTLGVDVALLQETVPPPPPSTGNVMLSGDWRLPAMGLRGRLHDGSRVEIDGSRTVRTPGSNFRFNLTTTNPGSVVVARLTVDGVQPITVVSIYNVIDVYAHPTLLRIIADLLPLFVSGDGARVIVAGDLNMSTADRAPNRTWAGGIFGALESLGLQDVATLAQVTRPASLVGCPCDLGDACRHFPTWETAQLDYVFVTHSLADQVRSLEVVDGLDDLSDHRPLVVALELDPTPTPRSWNPEEFAGEIGRGTGPKLAAWSATSLTGRRRKRSRSAWPVVVTSG